MKPPRNGEGDRSPQAGGGGGSPPLPRPIVADARRLRKEMSPPERLLWQRLRLRPNGLKFRRQHPIGDRLVADFFCRSAALVIEVDGKVHDNAKAFSRDRHRDAEFETRGYRVVHILASDVLRDVNRVAEAIVALGESPLHHPPAAGGPPPRSGEKL